MTGSKEIFHEQREYELSEFLNQQPSKSNIEQSANIVITAIKEGEINGFDTITRMEAVKLFCEQVRSGVESFLHDELEKYGKEGKRVLQAKWELAEVGVKYNYSNDTRWAALNEKLEAIKKEMKEREMFLKALSKPIMEVDIDTGETIEAYPAIKTSKSSFKITLSK